MSGYVASARIVSASPRALRRERREARADWPSGEAAAIVIDGDGSEATGPAVALQERVGRLRDRWAQLTFFLTDPESWR
jgi:hypothetical protein